MNHHPHIALTLFLIALSLLLVLMNAFFVASEFAIVKIRKTRLQELVDSGNLKAKEAMYCVKHLDEYLSATQLGITLVSLALGWIGEQSFFNLFLFLFPELAKNYALTFHTVALGVAFFIITSLHVIIGELVPKSMAIQRAEKITLFIAKPLHWFYVFAKPLIKAFTGSANIVLRFIGYSSFRESPWTEEELKLVMKDSKHNGVISEDEAKIIEKAFSFSDKTVSEIMVPLKKVEYISLKRSFEENKEVVMSNNHSRFPVCKRDMDTVVGIFVMKELRFVEAKDNTIFSEKMKRPLIVEPDMKQDRLMRLFSARKIHMAIVQDPLTEKNLGVVTLEDILEEIVGDIVDEYGN